MALSLTVTDNADGTGATGVVAGADVATLVTVYTSLVTTGNPLAWTVAGTRSGDGTLALPVSPSYYFAYASCTVLGAPAISPPVTFLASRATTSVYTQIKAALQARIQSLALAGLATPPGTLPPSRVYVFPLLDKVVFSTEITMPAVLVTGAPGLGEEQPGTLTGRDDIGYPVLVSIVDSASIADNALASTYELWRQQIFRAIRNQPLYAVGSVWKVETEPRPMAEWRKPEYQIFWSSLVFRAVSREPRGV